MVHMDTTLRAHRHAPHRRHLLARQILGDEPGDLLLAGDQLGRRNLSIHHARPCSLGELRREEQRAATLARPVRSSAGQWS